MVKQRHPTCGHDITIFDDVSFETVRDIFKEIAGKWVFQQETTKKGKLHFQCRIHLRNKERDTAVAKKLRERGITECYVKPCSSKIYIGNDMEYCEKEESRVAGPWRWDDIEIPWDLEDITEYNDWQKSLYEKLSIRDKRKINFVYNQRGCEGKTTFCRHMEIFNHKKVGSIEYCETYNDFMQRAYGVGPKEIYLLDLPKALEKSKMRQLFAACETLKGGKIVDARNKYRKLLFGAPRICVFTNDLPPMDMFSGDVWEIDTITADGQLVPYQIDTVDDDDIAMAIVEKAFKNVGEEMKPFKTSRPKKI